MADTEKRKLGQHLRCARVSMEQAFSIVYNSDQSDIRCYIAPIFYALKIIKMLHLNLPWVSKNLAYRIKTQLKHDEDFVILDGQENNIQALINIGSGLQH